MLRMHGGGRGWGLSGHLVTGCNSQFYRPRASEVPTWAGNLHRLLSLSQIWQRPSKSVAGRWGSAGKLRWPPGGRGGIPSSCLLGWGKGLAGPKLQKGSALRRADST